MGKILEQFSDEKGKNVIGNMILRKLTARNCGLKNVELVAPHTKLQFLDISGNPIESIQVLDTVKSLKYVIAKDTLITEDSLPALTLESKKEWVRIVIK